MDEHLEKLVARLRGLMDSGVLLPSEIVQAIQALAMMNLAKSAEQIADRLKSINEWCEVFADYMSKLPWKEND